MNNHSTKECQTCKDYKKIKIDNIDLKKEILKLESQLNYLNNENKILKKEIVELKTLNYDSLDEYFN